LGRCSPEWQESRLLTDSPDRVLHLMPPSGLCDLRALRVNPDVRTILCASINTR
jgi:hypothetical protein